MSGFSKHLSLVRIFISEERRLNASMIGGAQFLMFPVVILFMSFVLGIASEQLLKDLPLEQAYLLLHSVIIIYGMSVGGLATFGDRIAERRFGPISMVLQTPATQPISYRELFTAFYVKEIIYYFLYSVLPLVGGIALTIPLTGFQLSSVLFLLLTVTLSFLFGLSFSFFLSAVHARSRAVLGALLGSLGLLVLSVSAIGAFDLIYLVPSMALQRTHDAVFLLAGLLMFLVFSAAALRTVKVTPGKHSHRYKAEMLEKAERFSWSGGYAKLMGKEWIDLLRSRTLAPVLGAYVGPLAMLAALLWVLEKALTIDLEFNMVFYAAMIGFFSVSIYSWLNLLDNNTFMDVLPITVGQVIRTKLILLSIVALVTSTAFLSLLSFLLGEAGTLPLGLLVAYVTTAYTVTATAYLTGLRTNSYLFDPRVLGKFSGTIIPPLCALVILSLSYSDSPFLSGSLIMLVCAGMALATVLMYRGIGKRWDRATFGF